MLVQGPRFPDNRTATKASRVTPMTKKLLLGGVALALALPASGAFAQTFASPPLQGGPVAQAASSSSATASTPLDLSIPRVMVRTRRDGTKEAARAFSREDDLDVLTLDQFNALIQNQGKDPEKVRVYFTRIQGQNQTSCQRATNLIVRIDNLAGRYKDIDIKYTGLYDRTLKLKSAQNSGKWLRRLGGLLAIGGAAAISGPYALVVAPSILGGEANSTLGSDSANRLNRDATLVNNEHSRANIEHSLMTLEMDLIWVELVDGYCSTYYPQQTITTTSTSYTPH